MPETAPETPASGWRNFYGRLRGKTLRPAQRRYLDEDLPRWRLTRVAAEENPERAPLSLPNPGRPLWLEVGFGGGEHLLHMAQSNPQADLIGCEPYVNGVAMLLGRLKREPVANLRIHPGDVRDLFDVLPDAALARVFLNYPDPWPKARHHRRRFVSPEFLHPLARVMAPGGEFHVATDIPDYARQAREEVPPAGFRPVLDSATPWPDWFSTRYEVKALREGRVPRYLTFVRDGARWLEGT